MERVGNNEAMETIREMMRAYDLEGLPKPPMAVSSTAISENLCKICRGNNYIKEVEGYNTRLIPCECQKPRLTKRLMGFAEIPYEFKDLKINDFDITLYDNKNRKAAEIVKKIAIGYITNFGKMKEMGKGLYLYGETKGSGKTRLAVSIGNALISQHNQSVRFVTTLNLINEIKNTFDRESAAEESFSKLLTAAKTVDVLILDDFGTEKPTSWVNETFYTILNDRMTAKKITLFTSNCRVEDLLHDDRLVNRIGRMATPVKFPEESVRTTLAKSENEEVLKILLEG